jgi:hypothetical protein
MFFFKRSARLHRRPSPSGLKARLRVEQLESRLVPAMMLPHSEFLVNSNTSYGDVTSSSGAHTVATDSGGNYVVVWGSNGEDGSGSGVYARRYSATGSPLTSEFQVNGCTQGDQADACIAMDSAGDFVVTWSSNAQDGSGWGVYGQRYNSLGVAQGCEFRANTSTTGDQQSARVAMDSLGNFVVVWSSYGQDGSGWGVYGQRYSSLGVAQGGEFRINTTTTGDQEYATVAMNGAGNFVVTWSSYGQDGSGWGVYAQRYNSCGVAQGGEFRVNTCTAGDQTYSAAAMDTAGDFVITWSSYGQDGSGWGVYAQRYNCSGVAQGSEFRATAATVGDQMYSSVAMDSTGNFTITWQSNGQDGSGWGIYAQQFTSAGAKYGNETVVNTTTSGDQQFASITMTATGQAVIVWSGNGKGDSTGVFGQQWSLL